MRYRTDAELVQLSDRVVLARALRQRTERPNPNGAIYTVTTLAILEDLTGVAGDTVEVWELGGVYGGEGMYVGGAVEYRVGADVLVCLERGARGLRSVAMGFSKFDVTATGGGGGLLSRNVAAVDVVGGAAPGRERSLAEFRALVAQVRGARAVVNTSAAAMLPDDQPRFTTLSSANPRWFEADSATPVMWYQNLSFGSSPLTSGDVVGEIQTSLAAWTTPTTASIILQYVSTTNQTNPTGPWSGIPSNAGVISWEDPENNISGSTLAVGGGFFFTNAGTINGVTYGRFTRGYVLFQNAAEVSSSFRQAPNFTRVLVHEIGHAIGLGHTTVGSATASGGGTTNPNIMFASCCNSSTPVPPAIGPDDLDGVNTLYPVSGTTPGASCSYTISPTSATPASTGGSATVTVTASSSACGWTATVGTATFATITGGASGTGLGTVTYFVSTNASTSSRSGTLAIAGQTFTITQLGAAVTCTYSLTPMTATVTGAAGPVTVAVVSAAGCPWSAVTGSSFITVSAGSSGSGNGTVTLDVAKNTTSAARTGTVTIAGQTFTLTQSALPSMTVDRATLNFGAIHGGTSLSFQTPAQAVRVRQTGTQNTVTWTAASNVPWLTVTPAAGSGPAALSVGVQFASALAAPPPTATLSNTGTVTITYTGAATSISTITATLSLPGVSTPPAGVVDTPVAASGLQGSIAVSGWALDDIAIERVEIWRDLLPGEPTPPFASTPSDPRHGKVFVANATFVDGARPDVEGLNPAAPFNYRAGWGYLLLTWGLFNQGNGTYTLSVFAFDKEGKIATLGQRTIGVSNQAANKPFGSIDTPAIGGVASGTAVNFGWGITPKVNGVATCKIQPTGVQVSIDSGPLQPVNFGANRTDIGAAFPGFSNTDSAGGSFVFDTTALPNGVHTIGWLITDDCGRADGVGSRFFTVQNGSQSSAGAESYPGADFPLEAEAYRAADFRLKAEATGERTSVGPDPASVASAFRRKTASDEPVLVSRGYGELPLRVGPDAAGDHRVEVAPGERIELRLPRGFEQAYQLVTGERRALPIGASWDPAAHIFSWQPAAGFLGEFVLIFGNRDETIRVLVHVRSA